MSLTLEEALGQVELEPGRTYRTQVRGRTVVVRVSKSPLPPDPTPDEYLQNVMIDPPWIPDVGPGVKVTSKLRAEPLLPDPPLIDPYDTGGDGS